MAEVQPGIQRDTIPQDPTASEPRNPLTDFQELVSEDPTLILRVLGVSIQELGRTGENPSQLDKETAWNLVLANQKNAEDPSPEERVVHAKRTIQQVLGIFTASQMSADEETKRHPLYEDQLFRLQLIRLASKPNAEAEAAARLRLYEVALGIQVFGIARQSLRQSLEDAAGTNAPGKAQGLPQQREPAESPLNLVA